MFGLPYSLRTMKLMNIIKFIIKVSTGVFNKVEGVVSNIALSIKRFLAPISVIPFS